MVDPLAGVMPAYLQDHFPIVLGKTLLDMQAGDYSSSITQQQSKLVMRTLLAHHLHGAPLHTRQILIDLQNL